MRACARAFVRSCAPGSRGSGRSVRVKVRRRTNWGAGAAAAERLGALMHHARDRGGYACMGTARETR